jgi:hypothetical protein
VVDCAAFRYMVPINILLGSAAVLLGGASAAPILDHFLTAIACIAGLVVVTSLIVSRIILHVFIEG